MRPKLEAVLRLSSAREFLAGVEASPPEEVIVFRDGEAVARLREGRFVHWKDGRRVTVRAVDPREQTADVLGQEIPAGTRTAFVFGQGDIAARVRTLIDRDAGAAA